MKLEEIQDIAKSLDIKSLEHFDQYFKLVSNDYNGDEYSENHHILPKSLFPDYKNSSWNTVRLKYSDHIEAHRLLCYIFDNNKMKSAYSFMLSMSKGDRKAAAELLSGLNRGKNNPACKPGVGAKISKAKLGKPRPDLFNKRYFGSSDETIDKIKKKLSRARKDTVIVKWSDNRSDEIFVVSIHDQRYLDGVLIPFNKGSTRENSASKRKDVMDKIMSKREETYARFESILFDDLVDYLVDCYNSGKKIFGKKSIFGQNYSYYVKLSNHDPVKVKEKVVQRLSGSPE